MSFVPKKEHGSLLTAKMKLKTNRRPRMRNKRARQ